VIHPLNGSSGSGRTPRLKERLRQATLAAILDAAERVYAREGFEAGRMEQIAEAAGVSVGTLYNYFADRRALVESLLADRRHELLRRVDDTLAQTPTEPIERLRGLLRATFEHIDDHRAFVSLLVHESAGDSPGPSATFCGLRERIQDALEQALARNLVHDCDVTFLAHLLTGSLRAAILHRLATPQPPEPRATADRLLGVFLDGARN
jgi:AcrR family transcriptional regulator